MSRRTQNARTYTLLSYNVTFQVFGGPQTLVARYAHWLVLTRPHQATLGSVVLLSPGPETAFPDLPPAAFAELHDVTRDLETALRHRFACDKVNYLMLMMVDPHVHFHVLPRYARSRDFHNCRSFADEGWPGPPDLAGGSRDEDLLRAVRDALRQDWPAQDRVVRD